MTQKILAVQNMSHYYVLISIDYHCWTLGMECEATPGESRKDQPHLKHSQGTNIHSTTEHKSQRAWPEVSVMLPVVETTESLGKLANNAPPCMSSWQTRT